MAKTKQFPIKVTIRLSEQQMAQLERRATELPGPTVTVAELIRYAVEKYLQEGTP